MEEKKAPTEKLVDFFVDPELTDGRGLFINGKQFVGKVKVTQDQADDMQRIISEYQETVRALHDPRGTRIRIKNSSVIESMYLANPREHGNKPNFSKEYGLLDPWQWQYVNENFRQILKDQKKALYGN